MVYNGPVFSPGGVPVPIFDLFTCIDVCAAVIGCHGADFNVVTNECFFHFVSSNLLVMNPHPDFVQFIKPGYCP